MRFALAGDASHEDAGKEVEASPPLTQDEIDEYSRIKCYVCGQLVLPEDVTSHSRQCILEPAPNLRLELDKWCIASTHMTVTEQRSFIHMRRTEELARVEKIETNIAKRMTKLWWMSGKFGFVISSKWLRSWRSFVGVGERAGRANRDEERPPGPVNNNDLFELDGSLRVGLREGVQLDYHVLEQPLWELYSQVYGGGPTVLRYNTSGFLPTLNDQQASFDGDWCDLRPDTGQGHVFDPYSGFGFDGEIREGFLWSCVGKGLLRNGSHYEGRVERGLPDGQGREVQPDGTVLEGTFRAGELHGFGRTTDPQGKMSEGEWENGVLIGI
jgi:hypothetical protein